MATRRKKTTATKDTLVAEALECFRGIETHEEDWRREWADDLRFYALDQWPDRLKAQREAEGKACLVMDETSQYVRQVVNDIRLNPPSMQARPVDDKADIKVAEHIQGLFRHIEEVSRAENAYKTAAEWAAVTGRGFFRVFAQQIDPVRNLYEPRIGRIANALSVYFDEYSVEMDGSDATEAFVTLDFRPSEFKKRFKGSETSSFSGKGEYNNWLTSDSIRVAEWHRREERGTETIVETEDGQMTPEAAQSAGVENFRESTKPRLVNVVRKITALEVLEETEFFSEYIGIIPVYGNERFTEDKRELFGIIRPAKDPQRLNNYLASNLAQAVTKQAQAPWVAPIEAIEGFETEWSKAGSDAPYLPYNHTTGETGDIIPPPTRTSVDVNLGGFTQLIQSGSQRIQASIGMYQAAIGAPSNEKSGVAIERRNNESDVANYHFTDNLAGSIQHCGRIIMQMIPRVYDVPRVQRILGEDGSSDSVRIDPDMRKPMEQRKRSDGSIETVMNPNIGQYDVVVSVGPSFSTKREHAATALGDLLTTNPQLMAVFGDLWFQSLDFPGAQELAKRAKKLLPPEMAEPDENQAEIPEEVEKLIGQVTQVVQQREQMFEQTMQQIAQASEQLKKQQADAGKVSTQAQVDRAQAQTERAQVQMQVERANRELDATKAEIARAKEQLANLAKQTQLQTQNADLHIENSVLKAQDRMPDDSE